MIDELYKAGANEVIVRCFPFGGNSVYSPDSEEFVTRICEYLSDLRRKVPNINIGFMISASDANDASLAAIIDKINDHADFLAVDMTAITDAEELKTATNEALVSILRYKMRVLIRSTENGDLEPMYRVLDTLGIKNRQVATAAK